MSDVRSSGDEHVRWAKERALRELPDFHNAIASMVSDLGKHPETEQLREFAALTMLTLHDADATRRWIEGFAE